MEFDATEIANLIKTAVTKRSRHEFFFRDQNKKRQLNAVVSLCEEKALEEAKRCVCHGRFS